VKVAATPYARSFIEGHRAHRRAIELATELGLPAPLGR
jgi:hypothetical protein